MLTICVLFQSHSISKFLDWSFYEDVLEDLKHDVEAETDQSERTYYQGGWCHADDEG